MDPKRFFDFQYQVIPEQKKGAPRSAPFQNCCLSFRFGEFKVDQSSDWLAFCEALTIIWYSSGVRLSMQKLIGLIGLPL